MTAAQLARLAEQAAFASQFCADDNPSAARTFAEAGLCADRLSAQLARTEELARIRTGLAEVRADLSNHQPAL